jgi:4-hydroxy-tetrahydrodipicolinate synthase
MNYSKAEAKAAARAQFRGVWAAMTTPFTPDLELDEPGFRRNMRHVARTLKVEGVFVCGTMGEFWALTHDERKRVVEIAVDEAHAAGCKVLAHTAHHSAHETIELTRHAEKAGADFAILMNPYYPPMSEEAVYEWFELVASRVQIGLWMFDARFSGYNMSPELIARLARIENICGIKLSWDKAHYAQVKKLAGDKLVLSHPNESFLLEMIRDYGQQVYQSSQTPYLFQTATWTPLNEYVGLALGGRFDEAAKVAAQLDPLRKLHLKWSRNMWSERKVIPCAYVTAWSECLGMAGGPVRPGLPRITPAEREELQRDLEATGLLERIPSAIAA